MELEFHQIELRHTDLRIHDRARQSRLLAALAAQGQQVPVVVVAETCEAPEVIHASEAAESPGTTRYVLIDGYMRVNALQVMGHDTVAATVWPLSEADALVEHYHLSTSSPRSHFEHAWLLARLRDQGLSLDELSARLNRTKSWVSRHLGLVTALSQEAQAKVREGILPPHAAMKYLVPLARANKQHCDLLVTGIGKTRLSDRDVAELYAGWRRADSVGQRRICTDPALYLRSARADKAETPATDAPGTKLVEELATLGAIAWRARQSALKGLDFEATYKHLDLGAAWRAAQGAFDELARTLQEAFIHAGSNDPYRHIQAP